MKTEVLKITKVMDGVHVLDELGKDNMWLIEGEEKALLVDTGFGLADLKAEVAALTDKPVVVVNSHIHPDHSGGNVQFGTVLCGRFDEPSAHNSVTDENKKQMLGFFPELAGAGVEPGTWQAGPADRVVALKEGDQIPLGGLDIEVYEIPGHTLGSIALLDRKHKLLFTGDTLLIWQVWGQLNESAALSVYHDSLKKIASLKDSFTHFAPGHTAQGKPYLIENSAADVYVDGVAKILAGESVGVEEKTFAGDGLCVKFAVGGMVYNPKRL